MQFEDFNYAQFNPYILVENRAGVDNNEIMKSLRDKFSIDMKELQYRAFSDYQHTAMLERVEP